MRNPGRDGCTMPLIGYARVSTEDQDLAPQLDVLRAAGCAEVFEEHASGASRARPQLAAALARVRRGDTLVVARIDRLARSLSHLLEVVEGLRARGAHFRSLADPIDTAGPSGVLVLQMLGAVAEFERSLIRERTKAGLAAAKTRGRVGGNPGVRARDPATLARLARSRRAGRVADCCLAWTSGCPSCASSAPGRPGRRRPQPSTPPCPKDSARSPRSAWCAPCACSRTRGWRRESCSRQLRAGAPAGVSWRGRGRSTWRRRWWRAGPP